MRVVLELTLREWMTLDLGLAFFRQAPPQLPAAHRQARCLTLLHRRLCRAGIVGHYRPVTSLVHRERIDWQVDAAHPLAWDQTWCCLLGRRMTRSLLRACLTILEIQAHRLDQPLLAHEGQLLRVVQTVLTRLRLQRLKLRRLAGCARWPVTWHRPSRQYLLPGTLVLRLHQQACRERASLN